LISKLIFFLIFKKLKIFYNIKMQPFKIQQYIISSASVTIIIIVIAVIIWYLNSINVISIPPKITDTAAALSNTLAGTAPAGAKTTAGTAGATPTAGAKTTPTTATAGTTATTGAATAGAATTGAKTTPAAGAGTTGTTATAGTTSTDGTAPAEETTTTPPAEVDKTCNNIYGSNSFQIGPNCYKCSVDKMTYNEGNNKCEGNCSNLYGDGWSQHATTDWCFKCPDGMSRTAQPDPDAQDACKGACDNGSFEHSNACYRCEKNKMERSVLNDINGDRACEGKCIDIYGLGFERSSVSDWCYKCPDGMSRTAQTDLWAQDACKGSCESGSFEHDNACYRCNNNKMKRSVANDINGERACEGWCNEIYGQGYERNALSDWCYKCPDGMSRTAQPDLDAKDACKGSCPSGSFEHWFSGKCYSCPTNTTRSGEALDSPKACTGTCSNMYPGSFEHWPTGKCYSCPQGFGRGTLDIDGPYGCFKGWINTEYRKATYHGNNFTNASYITDITSPAIIPREMEGGGKMYGKAIKTEQQLIKPADVPGSIYGKAIKTTQELVKPADSRPWKSSPIELGRL
jgi:hypothetical protein